jgi:predicted metal-dependent hydrolase
METRIIINNTTFPVVYKPHSGAKRVKLRFDPLKASIKVTLPPGYSLKKIKQFIEESRPWLTHQVQTRWRQIEFKDGLDVPLFGRTIKLTHVPSKRCHIWYDQETLILYAPHDKVVSYFTRWLKKQALAFFEKQTAMYAEKLGIDANTTILVKETRRQWGSCSTNGRISYCWRLIFAPLSVAQYVCAHEVSHLLEMNHSPRFWKLVESICPDYETQKKWLKSHGETVFHYGTGSKLVA